MADLAQNFKVSAYPFKQYKKMLKNMKALLYTYFYNIFLNVLKPTFCNIQNLSLSLSGENKG